mmetsp:Transcript_38796/g.128447  ORF Transcript_38796/g.128447 Transcript_38796/m.128447 type:complete len:226 (+) Transcript_38796:606-1283(+)
MPPSIDANESGIRSTLTDRFERAAHVSLTGSSIATMGVLLRKADTTATGKQRRRRAVTCPDGRPSSGRSISWTARVSSSARATTKRAPMERTEEEQKPAHACASEMTPQSSSATVRASMTRSGGEPFAISSTAVRRRETVRYDSQLRHASSEPTHSSAGGTSTAAIVRSTTHATVRSTTEKGRLLMRRQRRSQEERRLSAHTLRASRLSIPGNRSLAREAASDEF